ncbi:hypothetical protein KPH14_012287, partial [Odynerus spinipes]
MENASGDSSFTAEQTVQSVSAVPSFENLFRQFLEKVAQSSATPVSPATPNTIVDAVPEFSGLDLVAYTSESANSYSEYARTKLKYYGQTQIEFKQHELISLVIGHVTDPVVRQSLVNARYKTRTELLSGISQFVKIQKRDKEKEKGREQGKNRDNRDHSRRTFSRKRCFECNEFGHVQHEFPKKLKAEGNPPQDLKKTSSAVSCTFCLKKGHEESQCWAKRRTHREDQSRKSASADKKKLEANVCLVKTLGLTPILFRDLMVHCLLDSGANCSMVREKIAKRADCKIEPDPEINFFVVPDSVMQYDAILGEDVLDYEDLCVKKVNGEKRLLHFPASQVGDERKAQSSCNAMEMLPDALGAAEVRAPLESLLQQFSHMFVTGHKLRSVSTGELKIVLKEDKT